MPYRGTTIDTAIIQYVAYLDGRIQEVAIDRYAQADDGSVWYFGEDYLRLRRREGHRHRRNLGGR